METILRAEREASPPNHQQGANFHLTFDHVVSFPATVRDLVVSAGNSVEVTLPRSEVELNAFVLPLSPDGTVLLLRTHTPSLPVISLTHGQSTLFFFSA